MRNRPTPLRTGIARLPEVELPYAEQGDRDGVPVVFVHAYTDSWRSFELVLPRLPASIRAVAMTQRGHGDASKPVAGYRVDDFASDLAAFVDRVGVDRAVLVASSSATFTVQRFTADHPGRVLGLVLIGVPWSLRDRSPSLGFLAAVARLDDPVDETFVRDFAAATTSDGVPRDFLDEMVAEALKVPAHVWKAALEGLMEAVPLAASGAITVPTLVIWGERDEPFRQDQRRILGAIPGSRLLVYPETGHIVHWEQPERVAADIVAFVEELSLA